MGLSVVTAPAGAAAQAVTLADVKQHLKITFTDDDQEIQNLLAVAQNYFEQIAGVLLCSWVYDQWWDTLPRSSSHLALQPETFPWESVGKLKLGKSPAVSVTYAKYYDNTNTLQTLAPSLYQVDLTGQVGFLVPAAGQLWPELYPGLDQAFNVRFACGFAAGSGGAANIPATAQHWIRTKVAQMYKEEGREGGPEKEPPGLESLLWAERCLEFL